MGKPYLFWFKTPTGSRCVLEIATGIGSGNQTLYSFAIEHNIPIVHGPRGIKVHSWEKKMSRSSLPAKKVVDFFHCLGEWFECGHEWEIAANVELEAVLWPFGIAKHRTRCRNCEFAGIMCPTWSTSFFHGFPAKKSGGLFRPVCNVPLALVHPLRAQIFFENSSIECFGKLFTWKTVGSKWM